MHKVGAGIKLLVVVCMGIVSALLSSPCARQPPVPSTLQWLLLLSLPLMPAAPPAAVGLEPCSGFQGTVSHKRDATVGLVCGTAENTQCQPDPGHGGDSPVV